jgi:hypothetical protein
MSVCPFVSGHQATQPQKELLVHLLASLYVEFLMNY